MHMHCMRYLGHAHAIEIAMLLDHEPHVITHVARARLCFSSRLSRGFGRSGLFEMLARLQTSRGKVNKQKKKKTQEKETKGKYFHSRQHLDD